MFVPDKNKESTALAKLVPGGAKPPAAPEVEKAVLGAMLIEQEAVPKGIEILKPDFFYIPAHRNIFIAMQNLFKTNEPIDNVTVYEELKKMQKAEEVGGALYLSKLSQDISSAAQIEYHAKIIAEKAILRQLITVSHDIASRAYTGADDTYDLLDYGEQQIFTLAESHLKKAYSGMDASVKEALEYIEAIHSQDYKKFAVQTGYTDLDDILGGFQKSDLVILAARPSMGKTALGLAFARNAAVEFDIPVAVFSLEMATVQLVMRMICSEGRINAHLVRTGSLPKNQSVHLVKTAAKLSKAPIYIDDTPAQSVLEIRATARRLKAEKDIGMIIVDYLQLMRGPGKAESREREISMISLALKSLAKELNIPVIALAQLNRAVESREDKRPMLADLRESGSLEQDADVVMFITRPEKYNLEFCSDGKTPSQGVAEIIIAKHRNGPTGDAKLRFIDEYARFENLDLNHTEDDIDISQLQNQDPMAP